MAVGSDKWARSQGYRQDFLKTNKGLFGGLYFCVYCGKPITRKRMQVDHHIAINHVKNNPLLKLYFGAMNTITNMVNRIIQGKQYKKNTGVNVSYNLVPACERCNKKKSDKGGIWIVRGAIGGTLWKLLNSINNVCLKILSSSLAPLVLLGGIALILFMTPLGTFLLSVL